MEYVNFVIQVVYNVKLQVKIAHFAMTLLHYKITCVFVWTVSMIFHQKHVSIVKSMKFLIQ